MLTNGQTYFENLAAWTSQKVLKYVWPFFNIIQKRVKPVFAIDIFIPSIQLMHHISSLNLQGKKGLDSKAGWKNGINPPQSIEWL